MQWHGLPCRKPPSVNHEPSVKGTGMNIFLSREKRNQRAKAAAREIGLNGTMADMRLAVQGAKEKYAEHVRAGLRDGAVEAFLKGRPENLQGILMSDAGTFFNDRHDKGVFLANFIAVNNVNADTLTLAFAKTGAEEKQKTLDKTLRELIVLFRWNRKDFLKKHAETVIAAGARADGAMLVSAAYLGNFGEVKDLLLNNGATYDDALKEAKNHGGTLLTLFEQLKAASEKEHALKKAASELTTPKNKPADKNKPAVKRAPPPRQIGTSEFIKNIKNIF